MSFTKKRGGWGGGMGGGLNDLTKPSGAVVVCSLPRRLRNKRARTGIYLGRGPRGGGKTPLRGQKVQRGGGAGPFRRGKPRPQPGGLVFFSLFVQKLIRSRVWGKPRKLKPARGATRWSAPARRPGGKHNWGRHFQQPRFCRVSQGGFPKIHRRARSRMFKDILPLRGLSFPAFNGRKRGAPANFSRLNPDGPAHRGFPGTAPGRTPTKEPQTRTPERRGGSHG